MISKIRKYRKAFVAGVVGLLLMAVTLLNVRKRSAVRDADKTRRQADIVQGQRTEIRVQSDQLDLEFEELAKENERLRDTPIPEVSDLESEWRKELEND